VRPAWRPDRHGLPGAHVGPQPGPHRRTPGGRAVAPAPRPERGRRAQGGGGPARPRRYRGRRAPLRRLAAPVFRRTAPAHHDCHGAGLWARPADRGRAHHGAGCHHRRADPAADSRSGARTFHGADPDLPRPRRHCPECRAHDGDVRWPGGRERPHPRRVHPARPSVHPGPVRLPAATRSAGAPAGWPTRPPWPPSRATCRSCATCPPAARLPDVAPWRCPTCESRMPADTRLGHEHHARCALLESAG
jgi:hypothetical protein